MQWWIIMLLVATTPVVFLKLIDFIFGRKPRNLGAKEGKLAPMAQTPKGVNSYTEYLPQKMSPIPFLGPVGVAVSQMAEVLRNLGEYPRISFYTIDDTYIWARDTSWFWRWKDDIEFLFDEQAHVIHFRSSPRYGYTDGGFNRRRMEKIIGEFKEKNHVSPS